MRHLIGIVLLVFASASHADVAVITGKNSPVGKLNERQVADIFMAKTTLLADGSRVQPVELSDASLRTDFYRIISGKTLPQVTSYWTTLIFTGKGKPPKSVDDLGRLIDILKNNPRTISYLPLDKTDDSVKVLFVFH